MSPRARHTPAAWISAVSVLALVAAAGAVALVAASRGDASRADAAPAKPTYAQIAPALAMYRARAYRTDDAIRLLHRARKTAGQKKVEPGESSGRVKEIQRRLVELKMLRPDQADGEYGDATQHAIMAFQKLNGLDRDGVAGPETLVELVKGGEKPKPFASKGAPDRVEVSLEKQLVQIIKGGKVVRVISASSGMPGHDTPPGTFAVYLKNPNAYSYLYDAPMPLASFFDGDIALHESGDVPGYPASHGCIRLPSAFASEVYEFATMGRQVIVV